MEPGSTSGLWIFLLSGLGACGLSVLFHFNPRTRSAIFRSINPALKDTTARKLSLALLGPGIAMLTAVALEVYPFPYARPYLVVLLLLTLVPLASLGIAAIFLITIFKRGK